MIGMSQILGGRPERMRIDEPIKTDDARIAFVNRFAIESRVTRSGSKPCGSILCCSGMLMFPLRMRFHNVRKSCGKSSRKSSDSLVTFYSPPITLKILPK